MSYGILKTKVCPHCGKVVIGSKGRPKKITDEIRYDVKSLYKNGKRMQWLANKFNLSVGSIHLIIHGNSK